MTTIKHSKQFDKYAKLIRSNYMTERDILNLKKLLNGYARSSVTAEEKFELASLLYDCVDETGGIRITPEQTAKGIAWLKNEYVTPRGVERKHNPFGYREIEVLENFSHFTFDGFYDTGSMYMARDGYHNYQPIYSVIAKDGANFQYYMARGSGYNGGSVEIVG